MSVIRSIKMIFPVCVVMSLQGCLLEELVLFEVPLPSAAEYCDTDLAGTWRAPGLLLGVEDTPHGPVAWPDGRISIQVSPKCEFASLVIGTNDSDGVLERGGLPFRVVFAGLASGRYVVLIPLIESAGIFSATHAIFKYEKVSRDTLRVSFPSAEFLQGAISAGHIEGFSEAALDEIVVVQARKDKLVDFLVEFDKEIFSGRIELTREGGAASHTVGRIRELEALLQDKKDARNEQSPASRLRELAAHTDPKIRLSVCTNKSVTDSELRILASDVVEYVADCVARNALSSPTTMGILANHSSQRVRSTLAGATHTPASILAILAEDRDEYVRRLTAHNRNTGLRTLERLSTDHSSIVRSGVAGHANASRELLSALSRDPDPMVRLKTVSEQLKYDDLNRLFLDDDKKVRDAANRTLGELDAKLREKVRSGSTQDAAILEKLARSNLSDSRRFVARQAETSSYLLVDLSQDQRKEVRRSVAAREDAPFAALRILARDPDSEVRQNVVIVHHANTRIMQILAHDPDPYVRGLVAVNANDVGVRLAMTGDPDSRVRRGLLMHRAVPIEIVRALEDDENPQIRSTASEWLMNTPADGWPRNGAGPQLMIEVPSRQ